MKEIHLDNVGDLVDGHDWGNDPANVLRRVIMVIRGASGRELIITEKLGVGDIFRDQGAASTAIKKFMSEEELWLSTQNPKSRKTLKV